MTLTWHAAEMFVLDERFSDNCDGITPGLDEHVRDAMLANARHTER